MTERVVHIPGNLHRYCDQFLVVENCNNSNTMVHPPRLSGNENFALSWVNGGTRRSKPYRRFGMVTSQDASVTDAFLIWKYQDCSPVFQRSAVSRRRARLRGSGAHGAGMPRDQASARRRAGRAARLLPELPPAAPPGASPARLPCAAGSYRRTAASSAA